MTYIAVILVALSVGYLLGRVRANVHVYWMGFESGQQAKPYNPKSRIS